MGELLKKTGAGNLFMIFGEPDVDIREAGKSGEGTGHRALGTGGRDEVGTKGAGGKHAAEDDQGMIEVEIKGLDVYDPTTGEVRSSGIADIACWFIDTDYNGESFFVRHAYFTGSAGGGEKGEGGGGRTTSSSGHCALRWMKGLGRASTAP